MNQREAGHPRGGCDPTGQGELQRLFKDANSAQPSPSIPKAFYGSVRPEAVDEIIESHIINDQAVERLLLPDEILNTTHKKDGVLFSPAIFQIQTCGKRSARGIILCPFFAEQSSSWHP
jgi:hypothetical protein